MGKECGAVEDQCHLVILFKKDKEKKGS